MAKTVQTTCAYCGVGCGIKADVSNTELHLVDIQGNTEHPANFGRLCSKGSALGETVSLEGRLLSPVVNDNTVSWDQALDEVAERLSQTIAKHGPESVALYGSGQLLTEDYYVANKFMKGFVGSSNMDTNSRLCMASTVAGHKRAFGSDTVPNCYEDLELCDLLVLVGSNTAWCHPVLFQRIRAAKQNRPTMKVVVIDPRETDTCAIADLHLPVKPGTDVALFTGLLMALSERGVVDQNYVDRYTTGLDAALDAASTTVGSLEGVAELCDVDSTLLNTFVDWFASTEKTVTAWSQGVNQSVSGTDKVNAILNCHLVTGRIGKPGAGPLSLTGQPNAMGGREVGGLANQLAAHMDFSDANDINRVRRFWDAPNMASQPGKTAVDLFESIREGEIKFVWIMGTNPLVSMPNADECLKALVNCPTVVVSDCIKHTDTSAFAHVLLPAAGWSEKDGTVTNSERRISRQRALFPLSGEAKPDWWIISQVAKRLGYGQSFDYQNSGEVFNEHAALSGFENNNNDNGKRRDFDISGLTGLSTEEYDSLMPVQWPLPSGSEYPSNDSQRLFAEGGFFTPDRKARIVPVCFEVQTNRPDSEYPFLFNTGRVRDQWHTMTRTGLSPRLSQHVDEPYLEIHPNDANVLQLEEQGFCRVSSAFGSTVLKVQISSKVREGEVFAPMHWTGQNSKTGRIGSVVNPVTDPFSRQPDSKHTPVKLEACSFDWHCVFITREKQDIRPFSYATEIRMEHGYRYELGHDSEMDKALTVNGQRIVFTDKLNSVSHSAWFEEDALQGLLLSGPSRQMCDRSWLQKAFGKSEWLLADRWQLLAGLAPEGEDEGKTVCACFAVGERTICRAIEQGGLTEPVQVGNELKAGTNCGSCIPEIQRLIQSGQPA